MEGVILDQPAGGGIGAAKRGASGLRSREARSPGHASA